MGGWVGEEGFLIIVASLVTEHCKRRHGKLSLPREGLDHFFPVCGLRNILKL